MYLAITRKALPPTSTHPHCPPPPHTLIALHLHTPSLPSSSTHPHCPPPPHTLTLPSTSTHPHCPPPSHTLTALLLHTHSWLVRWMSAVVTWRRWTHWIGRRSILSSSPSWQTPTLSSSRYTGVPTPLRRKSKQFKIWSRSQTLISFPDPQC